MTKGWYEEKDPVLRKARRHHDVAVRTKFEGTLRSPIVSRSLGKSHQVNVPYKGYLIDYTLRKEKGMNRYKGNMIIYKPDLSFMARTELYYLPDNSIEHVYHRADELIELDKKVK